MSVEIIKKLREITGAPIGACQKALKESNNDIDNAIQRLKSYDQALVSKKSGNETKEGVVYLHHQPDCGCMFALACESDFVARNEKFTKLAIDIGAIVKAEKVTELSVLQQRAQEMIDSCIAATRENIKIVQFKAMHASSDAQQVYGYLHNSTVDKLGRIGALIQVRVENNSQPEALKELMRNLCIHLAFSKPPFLGRGQVSSELLEQEKSTITEQFRSSGKPESLLNNIMTGKLDKFYQSVTFMEQEFALNDKQSVQELIQEAEQKLGCKITVEDYAVMFVGK